jgi:hypothetical protein
MSDSPRSGEMLHEWFIGVFIAGIIVFTLGLIWAVRKP